MPDIPIRLILSGADTVDAGMASVTAAGQRMAAGIGAASARISGSFSGVSARVQGLNTSLSNAAANAQEKFGAIAQAGQTVGRIGLGMTGAGAALGFLGVKAVQSAGQMQMWEIAFGKMMGSADAGHAQLQSLSDFAAKTPFTLQGLVPEAQKLMAMGFNASEVIPTLRNLGDAMAGLGQSEDVLDRVVYNLGQVRAQGHATAADLRQFAMAGINIGETMRLGTGKKMSQEEMTSMKAEDFIPAFQKGLQMQFGGMMEAQNKTLPGQLSNLTDQFFRLGQALGGPLVPAVTAIVQGLTGLTTAFTNLPAPLQSVIAWGGALTAAFLVLGGGLLALVGMAAGAIVPIMTLVGALSAGEIVIGGATIAIGGIGAALAGVAAVAGLAAFALAGFLATFYNLYHAAIDFWDRLGGGGEGNSARGAAAEAESMRLTKKYAADRAARTAATSAAPTMPTTLAGLGAAAAGIALPGATAGMDANKTALTALDNSIAEARAHIENLQDEVHASKDKAQTKLLQEELRMAQRDLQHLNRQRTAAAKDERLAAKIAAEATRVAEMRARVSSAQDAARGDLEKAGITSAGEVRQARDKAALDAQIKDLEAQADAGLIGKSEKESRIEALKSAYERRDRMQEADDKMQVARIEAQSLMAEARIKAAAQKGEEAKTTLALGKIESDKVLALARLDVNKAAQLNAIDASKAATLTPAQRIMQAIARNAGSVIGLPTGAGNEQGGTGATVAQSTQSTLPDGRRVIQFAPIVLADPWQVASRAYGR